jgi:hypothetical protein
MLCYRCGDPSHLAADCPTRTNPTLKTDEREQPECFICGSLGHYAQGCRLHPSRLRRIRGGACGDGPCTNACRLGEHEDCGFGWCTCICHEILKAVAQ